MGAREGDTEVIAVPRVFILIEPLTQQVSLKYLNIPTTPVEPPLKIRHLCDPEIEVWSDPQKLYHIQREVN